MNKRIDQLTLQLADLQVQYEAVQQSAGHTGDMQEVFDELTEREVSDSHFFIAFLLFHCGVTWHVSSVCNKLLDSRRLVCRSVQSTSVS